MIVENKEDLRFDPYTFWDNPEYWTVQALDIPQYAAVNAKLTKEQINAIKNYGKEIQTIKLFVDSVRQNPGEYLSSIGNEGWMNGVREVIQNSTDEMDRDVSPCNSVWVEYFEGTHRCIVSDNGRGIPADDIVRVFTREHTSTNFKKKEGVFSSGLHGVGAKCTNAVSSRFTVQSYILGKAYQIDFSEGKPLPKYKNMKPKEIPNKGDRQGLVVDFEPDFKVMKEITLTCADILQFLENLIPLLKIGAHIEFIGHLRDGKTVKKSLDNKNGVIDFITRQQVKNIIKPIVFGYTNGVMKVDIAMTYVGNPNLSANVLTFANMTPVDTQRSTPSKGFLDGLSQFFKNHMNRVYLASSKRKIEVTNGDVLTGLVGAVSAYHMSVMFDGQAKNVCKNLDFVDFVKQVTMKSLAEWVKNNPDDLQKLCEFIKDVALARIRADKEKVNISKKYKGQAFWDLPDGFKKAENKDHLELFIVEGLSAASPCTAGRNSKTQAIMPIRGKLLNAMNTPARKFLENKEVQGILSILGAGHGKGFDLARCKYDRIIILTDADFDSHNLSPI